MRGAARVDGRRAVPTATLIALDPAARIKRFSEYDHVAKYKIAKATDKLHGGTVDKAAMRVLKQRHDTSKANNPESKVNWAGRTIRERAEEIDKAMPPNSISRVQVYELPYSDMYTASHSCYGTLEYALVGLDSDPHLHFGRMAPETKPADLAFASMMILLDDVIDVNGIDAALGERLKAINDRRRTHSPA